MGVTTHNDPDYFRKQGKQCHHSGNNPKHSIKFQTESSFFFSIHMRSMKSVCVFNKSTLTC